jgi:TldD protein
VFAGRNRRAGGVPLVTLVDDGTMGGEWGCFAIDDEGRPAQRNVLIQDGVLVDYMWDGLRARKEGRPSSGNGRRQSYQHLPMVRMTNTYLMATATPTRRHHRRHRAGVSSPSSAAGRSTPPPATSCSA